MLFSTGLNWNIKSMKINLWYNEDMKQWRWTLVNDSESIRQMESGGQEKLTDAMNDIYKTVKYLLDDYELK